MYSDSDLNAPEPPRQAEIQSEIQQDYTRAEIYYQTLNIQTITQSEKYDVRKYNLFYNFYYCLTLCCRPRE